MSDLRRRLTRLEVAQEARRRALAGPRSTWVEQGHAEPLEAFLARLRGTRARLVRLAANEPASSADLVAEVAPGARFVCFSVPTDPVEWERRSIEVHAGQRRVGRSDVPAMVAGTSVAKPDS